MTIFTLSSTQKGPFPGDVDPAGMFVSQFEADHLRSGTPGGPFGPFYVLVTSETYHTGWIEAENPEPVPVEAKAEELAALLEEEASGLPIRSFAFGFHEAGQHYSSVASASADGRCGSVNLSHNHIVMGTPHNLTVDVVKAGKIFWGPAWQGFCPCGGLFDSDEHLPAAEGD